MSKLEELEIERSRINHLIDEEKKKQKDKLIMLLNKYCPKATFCVEGFNTRFKIENLEEQIEECSIKSQITFTLDTVEILLQNIFTDDKE